MQFVERTKHNHGENKWKNNQDPEIILVRRFLKNYIQTSDTSDLIYSLSANISLNMCLLNR